MPTSTDTIAAALIVEAMARGFDNVEKAYQKLSDAEQRAVNEMLAKEAEATSRLRQEMESRAAIVQQKHEEMRKQYDNTVKASLALGGAFGAAAAGGVAFLGTATQLAARVQTLGVVTAQMGQTIGVSEDKIRSIEGEIQKLGITTRASRESVAMMIQANLDLAKATDLARLAQNAAVVTGQNSSETFRDLIYAISSGSQVMLRRMMLSADFEAAYKREADAVGKTTLELTEAEKVTIRMNEVLRRGANIAGAYEAAMETAGKKVTSLERHVEEARVAVGEAFLPVYADLIDLLTNSLKIWNNLEAEQKEGISTIIGYATAIAGVESGVFLSIAALMKLKDAILAVRQAMLVGGLSVTSFAGLIALPVAAITMAIIKTYELNKELEANRQMFQQVEDKAIAAGQSYEDFAKAARKAAEEAGLVEVEGTFRAPLPGAAPVRRTGIQAEGVVPALPTETEYMTRFWEELANKREEIQKRNASAGLQELQAEKAHTNALNEEYQARIDMFRTSAAEQARWEGLAAGALEQARQQQLAALTLEAGLAAGVRGQLQQATEQYAKTIEDLYWQEGELVKEIDLATKKYGGASEKVADLTHKLDENRQKQIEAAEAMKEATTQMIYQQAAAGLDAAAALEMARAMGILSEADYAVASTIQNLRNQFDANQDGMIDAAEAAAGYTQAIIDANRVALALEDAGVDVTAENIAKGMEAIASAAEEGKLLPDSSIVPVIENMTNMETKAGEVQTAVSEIGPEMGTVATTAETEFGRMDTAAETSKTNVGLVTTEVGLLQLAIDQLPTEKTITIKINYEGTLDPGLVPGGQHGLDLIVPPGFNKDTFPVFASSGERVLILTKQQQQAFGMGGGNKPGKIGAGEGMFVEGDRIVVNNYTRGGAAMSMALIKASRAKRTNLFMGER